MGKNLLFRFYFLFTFIVGIDDLSKLVREIGDGDGKLTKLLVKYQANYNLKDTLKK